LLDPQDTRAHAFTLCCFLSSSPSSHSSSSSSSSGRTADLLDELKPRKVVALSLFDAVVDVVLLDAFDDMKVRSVSLCV
tara:strand:+ start:722 stop:958 length:237 start_codon:yes stop_codon:yes gene_type:complete